MRYIGFAFLMLLFCQSAFSQSKKDQIETLIIQKDSLLQTLSKEREMLKTSKIELEEIINLLKNKLKDVEFQVIQAKSSITAKNEEIMGLRNEILVLSDSINLLKANLVGSKKVKFLWLEEKYLQEYDMKMNIISLNEEFIKTITDVEKAAIGYVATDIGNECDWDGEFRDDRSNLKCKILSALDLGYQCSDQHLGFLRKWFINDKDAISSLENCGTMPFTSTIQNSFEEITLEKEGDTIKIFCRIYGFNLRESESWSSSNTFYFRFNNDNIWLIKQEVFDLKRGKYEY
jgi:hypothetical protein